MHFIQAAAFLRSMGAILVAGVFFVARTAHAQLNYLSATRSVNGHAYISTGTYSQSPDYVVSYSGDFVGSNAPVSQFADFSTNFSGTATLVYNWNVNTNGPWMVSASVWTFQSSFLHAQELSFSGGAAVAGSPSNSPGSMPSGAWGTGQSTLQVTFSVSAPVSYSLMCEGTGDPLSCTDSYSLSSANHGTLVSPPSNFYTQQYGVPIYYTGLLLPGDVYTLSAYSNGILDGGGLRVDLLVPEPSCLTLLGLGLSGLLANHRKRLTSLG